MYGDVNEFSDLLMWEKDVRTTWQWDSVRHQKKWRCTEGAKGRLIYKTMGSWGLKTTQRSSCRAKVKQPDCIVGYTATRWVQRQEHVLILCDCTGLSSGTWCNAMGWYSRRKGNATIQYSRTSSYIMSPHGRKQVNTVRHGRPCGNTIRRCSGTCSNPAIQ